ncbi:MAG: hypothetical protein IPK32_22975 [Verrucomicrobiaceae bacterium]|nr:hypothetical protein [Verrucomicrobiaceae bacterium]
MMKFTRHFLTAVGSCLLSMSLVAEERKASTETLLQDAEAILKMARSGDNIQAAHQSGIVFRAAGRLHEEGDNERSLKMYEEALRLSPWTLEHYLGYADTLVAVGQTDKAARWARSAWQRAEDMEVKEKARVWLKEAEPEKLPFFKIEASQGKTVCIIPLGNPPTWLLNRCGRGLQNTLGLPVMILEEKMALPKAHRSAFHRWAMSLRKDVKWDDPQLRQFAKAKGIRTYEPTDLDVVNLVEAIIRETRSAEELENFRRNRRQLAESKYDEQWDAGILLDTIAGHARQMKSDQVIWLAVTHVDLYIGDSNYCFGASVGPPLCAVNSCARFVAEFQGEPPDANRLSDRLLKQMLSSVGTLLGAARPIDPSCPRSYPQSLAEHDAKTLNLCGDCRASLRQHLGHEVPSLPEKNL